MTRPPVSRPNLSAPQITMLVAVGLLAIGIGSLILLSYFRSADTASAFKRAGYITTDLSNIQREGLLLRIETDKVFRDPTRDFRPVELRRSFLAAQLRVAQAIASGDPELTAGLEKIQNTLAQYDVLLSVLQAAPTPEQFADSSEFEAILSRLEHQTKDLYDRQENNFFQATSASLHAQHDSQILLLAIGGLVLGLSLLLAISLRRAAWAAFNRAYEALEGETVERERTEAALRNSEEKYRTLFEDCRDAIYIGTEDGRFVDVNQAALDLFGHPKEQLMALNMSDLFSDPQDYERLLQEIEQEGSVYDFEAKFRKRDGIELATLLTVTKRRAKNGTIPAYYGMIHDISDRKRLEEQLFQSQKLENIGRLAGGVAHDFNNMLTPIIGYAQLGKGKLPPGNSLLHDLDEIQKAAERATNLTSQLLAFSRHQIIEPRVINLNHLIVDTGNMLQRLIREDIQMAMLLRSEMKLVKVDPTQVEQVLVNLVINARDAMPNGGTLTIGTSDITPDQDADIAAGNYVMLEVSDNGVGMTAEVRAHLFEPFFTTKEVGQGTGLGLATCYGIVKQAGGHISVCSELGQGTSFKIYLPAADEGITKLPLSSEPATLPLGEETVLLVEDEELVRGLAAHILREQGYSVLEAANGVEALAVAEEYIGEDIHLLLTDVVMPAMGGRELADRFLTTRPGTKVLYCSGYNDDVFFNDGVLEHETAFLPKPFSPPALALKVREVLDS